MKKIFLIIVSIIFVNQINAQNTHDVLSLSQYFTGGTARGVALSGAYGALGADLTSLSINPAGIGVYRSSELVFSPGFTLTNTTSNYYNKSYTDNKTKPNFGNLGLVLNINSKKDIGWVSFSFGFAYNKLVDFNKNITIKGEKTKHSFLDEFVGNANYALTKNWEQDANYEQLAINSGAIYKYRDSIYLNDFMDFGYGQDQQRIINIKGNIGESAFSFGANYSNTLFLGATLGVQSVYYSEVKKHTEDNIPGDQLSSFKFVDDYSFTGYGVNLKIGAIYKPFDILRLGVALHTPTYYTLQSTWNTDMHTWFYNDPGYDVSADEIVYDFQVTSPLKVILSGALQSKIGFISFDYEYLNYASSRASAEDDLTNVNEGVQDIYRATGNLKVGGELKLGQFALRGGYGYYGSPYSNNQYNKDAFTKSYSGGFGYRGESMYIDLGYILFDTKYKYSLYNYDEEVAPNDWRVVDELASLESKMERFVLTVGFRF